MKAGRELDALVSEKFMRLGPIEALYYQNEPDPELYYTEEHYDGIDALRRLPSYSTDIAAAWEVAQRLQRAGWVVALMNYEMRWEVELSHEGHERYPPLKEQDTAPHAICLAALRAVGVEVDDA